MFQLQNKIENLKKSVENKFSLILKFIEIQNQNQVQNLSQNQTKTYAQAVATNIEENNIQQIKNNKNNQKKKKKKKNIKKN